MTTRNQRRQIQKLAEQVDKACVADAAYFKRRPDREHRLRRSYRAEVLQNCLASNGELGARLEPGLAWFTVVKNLRRGIRLRMFVPLIENADPDLAPEEHCREIYEALANRNPKVRIIEADMRRVACGGPAS